MQSNQQHTEMIPENDPVVSSTMTCYCEKKCKGHIRLKEHESCGTINGRQGITMNILYHEEVGSREAYGKDMDIDSFLGWNPITQFHPQENL